MTKWISKKVDQDTEELLQECKNKLKKDILKDDDIKISDNYMIKRALRIWLT